MEYLTNFFLNMGAAAIFISLITICLIWLFIRSAVASGTRQGIIDAYNELNKSNKHQQIKDFEDEMKGWE